MLGKRNGRAAYESTDAACASRSIDINRASSRADWNADVGVSRHSDRHGNGGEAGADFHGRHRQLHDRDGAGVRRLGEHGDAVNRAINERAVRAVEGDDHIVDSGYSGPVTLREPEVTDG